MEYGTKAAGLKIPQNIRIFCKIFGSSGQVENFSAPFS